MSVEHKDDSFDGGGDVSPIMSWLSVLVLVLGSCLLIAMLFVSVDVSVADQVSVEEYSGEYESYGELAQHEQYMVGGFILEPDSSTNVLAFNSGYAGAYEYQGTVYVIEESSFYFDFLVFEWRPFGE